MRAFESASARTSTGARTNGSGAHTAKPWVASRRHRSSKSGRTPMMSGCTTSPLAGMPSGRAWTASTDVPSGPFNMMCSTSTSCGPVCSSAISDVPLEDRGLGEPGQALLDRLRPHLTHAFDLGEVGDARPHDLLQVGEAVDDVVGHQFGQPRDLVEEAEAARLQRTVDADVGIEVQHPAHEVEVEELFVLQLGEEVHHADQ